VRIFRSPASRWITLPGVCPVKLPPQDAIFFQSMAKASAATSASRFNGSKAPHGKPDAAPNRG
jgi:hypothetical protein